MKEQLVTSLHGNHFLNHTRLNLILQNKQDSKNNVPVMIIIHTAWKVVSVMSLEIINNTFNRNIDEVKNGELFTIIENEKYMEQYGSSIFNGIFIKINNDNGKQNAVKLNDGHLYCINNTLDLQVINGKLLI